MSLTFWLRRFITHESHVLASPLYVDVFLGVYCGRVRARIARARAHGFISGKSALGRDIGEYFYVHPYLPFAKRWLLRAFQ